MKKHRIEHGHHTLECYEQGAHLSSWKYKGVEQLFLSSQTIFDSGVALRGGVPICFPQFAVFGPGQKHGFARNIDWQLDQENDQSLVFSLVSSDASKKIWPHEFKASFTIKVQDNTLTMSLDVTNTGHETCEFTSALHTYFQVNDIRNAEILGLNHCEYWDNGTEFSDRNIQDIDVLKMNKDIDRVFFNTSKDIELIEKEHHRVISSEGFTDAVVWNPWEHGASGLKDMADDEYLKMICIESANVENAISLAPGESWSGVQRISII